ncbi:hypothetical protein, partial [Streptomyces lasiicapitis]
MPLGASEAPERRASGEAGKAPERRELAAVADGRERSKARGRREYADALDDSEESERQPLWVE